MAFVSRLACVLRFGAFVALCLPLSAFAIRPSIILWHNLEIPHAHLLRKMTEPAVREGTFALTLETGFDLSTALVRLRDGVQPDAVLAPADIANLDDVARFSDVPPALVPTGLSRDVLDSLSVNGKLKAVPVFLGNHLMLFYNKALTAKRFTDFNALFSLSGAKNHELFVWNYREPFFLFPFLGAFVQSEKKREDGCPFSEDETVKALEAYRALGQRHLISKSCNYDCMAHDFYNGLVPFSISGDWAIEEARRHLGDNLGIAPLPQVSGRTLRSYYMPTALFFPHGSLQGPKRKALLDLAKSIAGPAAQKRWLSEGRRLPADLALTKGAVFPNSDLQESFRILKAGRPYPRVLNPWFVSGLRRAIEHFLDGDYSAQTAARLIVDICTVKAPVRGETLP